VHLGTEVTPGGADVPCSRRRARAAIEAIAPLALRVFGTAAIELGLKLSFLWSLVQSRLVFNQHVVVPSIDGLRHALGSRRAQRSRRHPRRPATERDVRVGSRSSSSVRSA